MMLLVEDTNFTEMLQYYCISEEFHNYLPIFFKSPPNQFSFGLQFLLKMKKHIILSHHQAGPEGGSRDCRPFSLTSLPGNVMKFIVLSAIMQHIQDNQAQSTWDYKRQVLLD